MPGLNVIKMSLPCTWLHAHTQGIDIHSYMVNINGDYYSRLPGRDADPSPPSSAEIKNKSRAIPLLSLRAFVACERVKPTY